MVVKKTIRRFEDREESTYTLQSNSQHFKTKQPIVVDGRYKQLDLLTGEVREYTRGQREDNNNNSLCRTKRALKDIVDANDWSFFCTLTFDPVLVDRYDDEAVFACFRKWRDRIKKKFPDMYYVCVPERHKREFVEEIQDYLTDYGAIHFHLLIGGVTAEELGLVDSHKRVRKGATVGQAIYNIESFTYGHTTATEIKHKERCRSYMLKYMEKDLGQTDVFKKRYYHSENCKLPEIETKDLALVPDNLNLVEKASSFLQEDEKIIYSDSRYNYFVTQKLFQNDLLGNRIEGEKNLARPDRVLEGRNKAVKRALLVPAVQYREILGSIPERVMRTKLTAVKFNKLYLQDPDIRKKNFVSSEKVVHIRKPFERAF